MVFFNYALRKLNAKIVYYGPGLCGKTSNLQWIHDHFEGGSRGKMISLATEGDRTIFFDLLPIDIGTIRGMAVTLQLYTVPGQVHYNATRQLVLKSADGVVFVADSQRAMLTSNQESWTNLKENLLLQGVELARFPHVIQFNKRDLRDILTVEDMDEAINEYDAPIFESVATEGIGVQESLEGIVKLVMRSLRDRYEGVAAAESQGPVPPARLEPPRAAPTATVVEGPRPEAAGALEAASAAIAPPPPSPPTEEDLQEEAITNPAVDTRGAPSIVTPGVLPPVIDPETTASFADAEGESPTAGEAEEPPFEAAAEDAVPAEPEPPVEGEGPPEEPFAAAEEPAPAVSAATQAEPEGPPGQPFAATDEPAPAIAAEPPAEPETSFAADAGPVAAEPFVAEPGEAPFGDAPPPDEPAGEPGFLAGHTEPEGGPGPFDESADEQPVDAAAAPEAAEEWTPPASSEPEEPGAAFPTSPPENGVEATAEPPGARSTVDDLVASVVESTALPEPALEGAPAEEVAAEAWEERPLGGPDQPLAVAPAEEISGEAPPGEAWEAPPAEGPDQPFVLDSGDPFAVESDGPPFAAEASAVVAMPGALASTGGADDAGGPGNQLHVRLEGAEALARSGDVRELDIVVPVPGGWIGNRRMTLQLRLTLVPAAEEER